LGSIPTGFLVAKAKGVDIRQHGSGNIGATNVFRILGKPAGIFVLLADAAKGWVAVKYIGFLAAGLPLTEPSSPFLVSLWNDSAAIANYEQQMSIRDSVAILSGIFVILGHNYTCWLKFKGGKGVATTAGVLLAWTPAGFGIALAVWLVTFAVSRYVSLASIAAAVSLPLAAWAITGHATLTVVTAALGTLAIYKHKDNIKRLLNGTEHRFGQKKDPPGSTN
jgi:acyl phosphate:glycerol-3-phosphate acyltransferase